MKVNHPFHRPLKLTLEQRTELSSLIENGAVAAGFENELWTAQRVQELIEQRFGVHYNVTYLPVILHELGFSPRKPVEKAAERDEKRIRTWVHKDWRDMKKKPVESEHK